MIWRPCEHALAEKKIIYNTLSTICNQERERERGREKEIGEIFTKHFLLLLA